MKKTIESEIKQIATELSQQSIQIKNVPAVESMAGEGKNQV